HGGRRGCEADRPMNPSVGTAWPQRRPLPLRLFHWWLAQVRHVLPPTIFFFLGFNLVLWTQSIVLQQHGIELARFGTATVAALLVGKAVLVTDNLPFMRRFDGAPLIQPVLFKTSIYWVCVLVVRFAEGFLVHLRGGGEVAGFLPLMIDRFSWEQFLLTQ